MFARSAAIARVISTPAPERGQSLSHADATRPPQTPVPPLRRAEPRSPIPEGWTALRLSVSNGYRAARHSRARPRAAREHPACARRPRRRPRVRRPRRRRRSEQDPWPGSRPHSFRTGYRRSGRRRGTSRWKHDTAAPRPHQNSHRSRSGRRIRSPATNLRPFKRRITLPASSVAAPTGLLDPCAKGVDIDRFRQHRDVSRSPLWCRGRDEDRHVQ
jgi:hypothetical protein